MALTVRQMRVGSLGTFCYLVTEPGSREAVLIDPAFETGKILAALDESGCRLTCIINTHGHSDHTAGNAAVHAETGAPVAIHKADARKLERMLNRAINRVLGGAGSPKAEILLSDGDEIPLGNARMAVLHTPGHTPGGICLLAEGNLFTGDTLFVGGVGRTDLPGGSAKMLLASIRNRLYTLPEETTVWPGHDYGATPSSTIAHEKAANPFTTD